MVCDDFKPMFGSLHPVSPFLKCQFNWQMFVIVYHSCTLPGTAFWNRRHEWRMGGSPCRWDDLNREREIWVGMREGRSSTEVGKKVGEADGWMNSAWEFLLCTHTDNTIKNSYSDIFAPYLKFLDYLYLSWFNFGLNPHLFLILMCVWPDGGRLQVGVPSRQIVKATTGLIKLYWTCLVCFMDSFFFRLIRQGC